MAEKRKFARIPLAKQCRIRFKDKEQFVSNFIKDVSLGGMFLRTKTPMSVGTVFNFEFEVPGARSAIRGRGVVVRIGRTGDKVDGMGIRFLSIEQGKEALNSLIRNYPEAS